MSECSSQWCLGIWKPCEGFTGTDVAWSCVRSCFARATLASVFDLKASVVSPPADSSRRGPRAQIQNMKEDYEAKLAEGPTRRAGDWMGQPEGCKQGVFVFFFVEEF